MRFRIWNRPLVIEMNDRTFPVKSRSSGMFGPTIDLSWLGVDGTEYTLIHPRIIPLKKLRWELRPLGNTICTGEFVHPSWRDFWRFRGQYIQWTLPDDVWTQDALFRIQAKRKETVRDRFGRKVAVWREGASLRKGAFGDIVTRYRYESERLQILIAMMLAATALDEECSKLSGGG